MNFRLRYAFLFPGVNSRAELVPSPRANARNGASRRWLGDYSVELSKYVQIVYRNGDTLLSASFIYQTVIKVKDSLDIVTDERFHGSSVQ